MFEIFIFNVELGQCAFIYPRTQPQYGMLVDIGSSQGFDPITFLIEASRLHVENSRLTIGNLTLTNYDHDHFSGLPNLLQRGIHVKTANLSKNLSAGEIYAMKEIKTQALEHLKVIKETYVHPAPYHQPPYSVETFHLEKEDIEGQVDTNNLSQMVIVTNSPISICFPGDLEKKAWELLLKRSDVQLALGKVNILVAPHHGRENGYHPNIFDYCSPECIIISDKSIVHDTQEGMSSVYSQHVVGDGVVLNGDYMNKRKVLTTRKHGHIWIQYNPGAGVIFRSF